MEKETIEYLQNLFVQLSGIEQSLVEIVNEYNRATEKFPPFHSAHEGYAVLLEEVKELEAEVFARKEFRLKGLMRDEAIQVAAMALRFIHDCGD